MELLALVAGLCLCILTAVVARERRRNALALQGALALRELLTGLQERHGEATFHQMGSQRALLLHRNSCSLVDLQPPALVRTVRVDEVDVIELTQVTDSMARLNLRLRGGERLAGPEIREPAQLARAYTALSQQVEVTFPRLG
jgi:hypothetical protein